MKVRIKVRTLLYSVLMLSCSNVVFSGDESGRPRSIDEDVNRQLEKAFYEDHYYPCENRDRKLKERCVSAYLWDNRHMLSSTAISKNREVDLVICIMKEKGVGNFERFTRSRNFSKWCREIIK